MKNKTKFIILFLTFILISSVILINYRLKNENDTLDIDLKKKKHINNSQFDIFETFRGYKLRCDEIFDSVCVFGNGDIICSCRDNSAKKVYGNVYKEKIYNVFNNKKYVEARIYMLQNKDSYYCKFIKEECMFKIKKVNGREKIRNNIIKSLVLEPTTECNLRCPGCPATKFNNNKTKWKKRIGTLKYGVVRKIINQTASQLNIIRFFNFGEPFLSPDAIKILKYIKTRNKEDRIEVQTTTNGLPLNKNSINEIVKNELLHSIGFAIDGCDQESYQKYRCGGKFKIAFTNMQKMIELRNQLRKKRPKIYWQYILFKWNDSDKQITKAKKLADKLGIEIQFLLTHTNGRSKRRIISKKNHKIRVTDQIHFEENKSCE